MKVLLLWNRAARKGEAVARAFLEKLTEEGFLPLVFSGCDEPARFSRVLQEHGASADLVAVIGGDGTINAALSGLLASDRPLVCVPAGTANNFVRNVGMPSDMEGIVAAIRGGVVSRVDVGFVNGTPFLTVCGIGISTLVNESTPSQLKRLLGPLAFVVQFLRVAWRHRPFLAKFRFPHKPSLKVPWVSQITVCNGRYYAVGLPVDGEAAIDDGQLDVLCSGFRKWWQGLIGATSFWRGQAKELSQVVHVRAPEFELRWPKGVRIDVDGDLKERTPARFSVQRHRLSVVLPGPR